MKPLLVSGAWFSCGCAKRWLIVMGTDGVMATNPIYNAASQTTQLNIGSAVQEQYTFDPQTGLLTNQKVKQGATTHVDLSYDYANLYAGGNATWKTGQLSKIIDNKVTNGSRNREYNYDKLGRLTKVKGGLNGGLWQQEYAYDRWGNRTGITQTGTSGSGGAFIPMDGLGSLSYNTATNRITSANFAYDAAGNQTQANENGQVNNYKYDAAGRLAEVTSGGLTHTYAYGASNQRLEMVEAGAQGSTTLYAWAGGQVIAEYNGVGSGMAWTKSYVYLGGRLLATDSTSGIQYHHPDRLGTRLVTNTSGGVVSENLHLPFGTTITGESNNLAGSDSKKRFTSYDRSDNTKLDYAVNRHYSAAQGRFTQVDPIGMSAVSLENPQSLNLYAYCFNDPVNHVDPEGLFIDAGAGGALGGVVGAIIGAVLGALRVIFGGRGPRTRMGARLEQRLAPVETGSSGDWEEPTVETGVGAVATQVKARPKLRPRQHRKKKPPNKGGEGGKSTSVIAGGATVVAAAVVVASAVSRIDCNVIRALISLEQQLGTRLASVEAVWGNNPINNIPGKLAYNGKSLDLDWYVKVRSKMQGGIVPTSLDVNVVYFGGKSLWGVTKVVWWAIAVSSGAFPPGTEIPLTPTLTSIPYVDAGEREAIKLLSRNLRYSQIFNEQWMKENCNSK